MLSLRDNMSQYANNANCMYRVFVQMNDTSEYISVYTDESVGNRVLESVSARAPGDDPDEAESR